MKFSWTHGILTASLVAFLPAVHAHAGAGHYLETCLLLAVLLCSTLMHATETKHGLDPGPALRRYSSACLNVDRLMAVVATFNMTYLYSGHRLFWLFVAEFAAGAGLAAWGERTRSLPLYVTLHMLWHLAVAHIAYRAAWD